MKKYKLLFFITVICIFLSPFVVEAKTTKKKCNYYISENQLSNSGGGTIKCTFNYNDSFFGGFSYSCKYTGSAAGDVTILIGNYSSKKGTGFALDDWFKENKSCPRYLVFDSQNLSSNGSTYAANTEKQVKAIQDKYGAAFSPHLENSIRDEEIESNPDSEAAKSCNNKKTALDNSINLLQSNRDKLIEKNCQNYKLSEEERESVASAENIQWGRECKQITDTYDVTVNTARTNLNDYVKSGCLDKNSDTYKQYESRIDGLKAEVDEIDDNIEEQNTAPSDSDWEKIEGTISSDGLNESGTIGCDSIFSNEEGTVGWMLNTILNYIKVLGPVLVVLLSAIDFIKAVVGFDEKAMKEAQNKLIIRLVAALALFLVPTLVQLLLSFINMTTCTI